MMLMEKLVSRELSTGTVADFAKRVSCSFNVLKHHNKLIN